MKGWLDMIRRNTTSVKLSNHIKIAVVEQGYTENDHHWRYHKVNSPFHRLFYVSSGTVYVRDESSHNEIEMKEGDIYFIPKDTTMDYYAKASFALYYYHLNYYSGYGRDLIETFKSVLKVPLGKSDCENLLLSFEQDNLDGFIRSQSSLFIVLSTIIERLKPKDKPVLLDKNPYRHLIERMLVEDVNYNVETMASFCGESISSFSHHFTDVIGKSPKQYLHDIIIDRSKMMLLTTDLSVKAIALELGFDDSLYFSRFFFKTCWHGTDCI